MPLDLAGVYCHEAGPLAKQVIMFEKGLNAVYGLNGSGKSFLVETLAAYGIGKAWLNGGLLFRFRDPSDGDSTTMWDGDGYAHEQTRVRPVVGLWNHVQVFDDVTMPSLTRQDVYDALLGVNFPDDGTRRPGSFAYAWVPWAWGYDVTPDTDRNRAIIDEVLDHGFLLAQAR